ncbi:C-C motif chemokine 3-like [Dromiciops gliroides]|uniref:C-C motif chemokine 3-like n=1 Tax=Dromiciops gliroides TaxID=33562 RepID=UPI001CC5B27E|nr:C-C motif chemokine 3-like [Dromiciops gliroides]
MISLPVLSIFLISISGVFSEPLAESSSAICCFSTIQKRIPQKFVVDYVDTSPQCPNPGVIFITRRDYRICANPQDQWVQEYVAYLLRGRV